MAGEHFPQENGLSPEPRAAGPAKRDDFVAEEPRSWLSRAADEVAAWLGDPDAAGRRQRDKAAGDHTGEGPAGYVDTDERIRDELNKRLTFDPHLNASRIEARVVAGAVTLTGSVNTTAERRRAEDVAIAVPGVNQTHNRLVVD